MGVHVVRDYAPLSPSPAGRRGPSLRRIGQQDERKAWPLEQMIAFGLKLPRCIRFVFGGRSQRW
eukprot:14753936-Alexandrium_andersonii.AAC.1